MGRTALYRDPVPFRPARAEIQLDADALFVSLPDGRHRRHALDGFTASLVDGLYAARVARASHVDPSGVRHEVRIERRFVRMLVLEREGDDHETDAAEWRRGASERLTLITPPERGAVAPTVVRLPAALDDAVIVDDEAWEVAAAWLLGGGRFSGCSIAELARLAAYATSPFAALIGEVAAQRALELTWAPHGPLRGVIDGHGFAGRGSSTEWQRGGGDGHDLRPGTAEWQRGTVAVEVALHPLVVGARHSSRVGEALVAALAHATGALRPRRRA